MHFLVLGGLVFIAFSLWGESRDGIDRDVVVTSADVARLEALWQAQYSRPPSADELSAIIDNHVKEEVLYREAMALGLADDDIIVRRRLVQVARRNALTDHAGGGVLERRAASKLAR